MYLFYSSPDLRASTVRRGVLADALPTQRAGTDQRMSYEQRDETRLLCKRLRRRRNRGTVAQVRERFGTSVSALGEPACATAWERVGMQSHLLRSALPSFVNLREVHLLYLR